MLKTLFTTAVLLAAATPAIAASFQLEVNNPKRLSINGVTVHGATLTGQVCGGRAVCKKTVTFPDGVCSGEVRINVNNTIYLDQLNLCGVPEGAIASMAIK